MADDKVEPRAPRLSDMAPAERLLLLQLVCAFAWSDGAIQDAERRFVRRLAGRLDLSPDESKDVESWLLIRPAPVDPAAVPAAHRRLFVDSVRALVFVDGAVTGDEQAHFDELRQRLLG
jgi:hypothetical protein